MRLALAVLALLAAALPAAADNAVPFLPMAPGSVMIFSPGNADSVGYRIVLTPNGDAVAVDGAGRAERPVSAKLAKALFDDVAAAAPLSKLPTAPCSRPASVIAPLLITFGSDTTPDVGCNADAKEATLFADAQAIAHALYVANYRSRFVSHFVTGGQAPNAASIPAQATPAPAPPSGGYGSSGGYGGYSGYSGM